MKNYHIGKRNHFRKLKHLSKIEKKSAENAIFHRRNRNTAGPEGINQLTSAGHPSINENHPSREIEKCPKARRRSGEAGGREASYQRGWAKIDI